MGYLWGSTARHRGVPGGGQRPLSGIMAGLTSSAAAATRARHSLPRRQVPTVELLFVAGAIALAASIPGQTAFQSGSVSQAPSPAPPAAGNATPGVGGSGGEEAQGGRPSPTAAADAVPGLPQPTPSADPQASVAVPADAPRRIVFREAGIDMNVVPMDFQGYVLDPPEDENAHWVKDYGIVGPDATDTAYLIAHSCEPANPGCTPERFPFNRLSSLTATGQTIHVQADAGEFRYRVTGIAKYGKDARPEEKHGTWDQVPGRLVLISCYTRDVLGTNIVVFADLER